MKILVTGSTGRVGSQVIKELRKRNTNVRSLVRSEAKSKTLPSDVEVAIGDLLDPVTIEQALDGVEKVYLLNAVVPDELTQGLIVCNLAKKLKIQHVVYQSVFQADRFKDVPHFASKLMIEAALKDFDVPYTILRPSYFFQNDAMLKEPLTVAGIYPMPLGSQGISAVDVRDIAEAAAIVLTSDGHQGKIYNLVGPSLLSGPGAASIWSEILQKEISYAGHDFDAWEEQMRQNVPNWLAFDLRMMFQGFVERGFIANDNDIEALTELLGHAPRNYRDFARETADAWQRSGR
ncbi:MAG TPA: NmrA family NAD(P)-binding protein [Candidatus Limnocylindrales bacterium]|nr:NmrA family NAD(P)-binding protein [Candidatus Limnocylindrales bacterium]